MNVLIVGGSSDIGKSLATFLRQKGYNVIVSFNLHPDKLNNIEFVKCNIKDETSIENTFKYVINKYGNIDILINMAAISNDNYFLDKTKEEFMNVLEVNLVGTFLLNKTYCKYMRKGIIINIASTDGIDTGSIYNLDYSASKAGIINMSRILNNNTDNKVICICPNWIDSESTRSMDKEYLTNELKRINQSRLITIDELNNSIYQIINAEEKDNVYRIDIKEGALWIEKI